MAERRNVCVLFWRRTGVVARSTVRALHHRRNWAHALSAKRIRYHDARLAAWRPAARFAGDHASHDAIHEKTSGDGRRSNHDRLNLRQRRASVGGLPKKGARALRRDAGDEVGIVASALLIDGRFAVLADRSTTGNPAQWGEAVVKCHDDFDADDVVVEVNFGGDMATEV